jgi:hypothetical protein
MWSIETFDVMTSWKPSVARDRVENEIQKDFREMRGEDGGKLDWRIGFSVGI